jgi:Flp pilus assembly protein TadD
MSQRERETRNAKRETILLAWRVTLIAVMIGSLLVSLSGATPGVAEPATLKVVTGRAGSVIFINNVRHGTTNEEGSLDLKVKAGSYPVRVRTVGFSDWKGSVVLASGAARTLKVNQQPTSDEALLHFQKGDDLRDKLKSKDAVKEYEQAITLRPVFPEARVALTRSLISLQRFQEAEAQIQAAMKDNRGPLPEAHTVLANLRRQQGLTDEAIAEYRKALRLARGVSAEAHIGLAIALNEAEEVDASIREYRIGIAQDMETEPILYYQLGSILEKAERKKEAVEAYQNYLRLDPKGELASAVESMIEMLKR